MFRKVLSIILVLLWGIIIFSFSSEDGSSSKNTSENVSKCIIKTVTNIEDNSDKMDNLVEKISFPIRKCAHIFLYFVFAILIYNAVISFKHFKYDYLIVILLSFLFSISDEIHQLFSCGRSSEVRDILIDTVASIFGVILFKFIIRRKYEKNN